MKIQARPPWMGGRKAISRMERSSRHIDMRFYLNPTKEKAKSNNNHVSQFKKFKQTKNILLR